MMEEGSLESEPSSQVDQCDPKTTVLFQPPANVVRKRWDPKMEKNLLIARPATRSEFQSWEIEKMLREAPKVEAPKIPGADEAETNLPASLRYPPRYPTERAAMAYRQWPSRPGTAAAHGGRRTARSPAFGAAVAANYEHPPPVPAATFSYGAAASAAAAATAAGCSSASSFSTVRLLHAPISATEYVSRQQKRRPDSAPPTSAASAIAAATIPRAGGSHGQTASGGAEGARGAGGDGVAPAWRRSHFVASTPGTSGEPAKATTWAELKLRQKKHRGEVSGDAAARNNHNHAYGAPVSGAGVRVNTHTTLMVSAAAAGSRPATARFYRKEDAASRHGFDGGVAASAKEKRSAMSARGRPASAHPTSSNAHAHAQAHANRARVRAGAGRGGGKMPVDGDLVAELVAARRGKVKVMPSATSAAKKTTAVLDAIAASLGGGGGGLGAAEPEPEGSTDGFTVQEMIPVAGHLERMREMARELDPRQQLWVARSMDKARRDIREMMT